MYKIQPRYKDGSIATYDDLYETVEEAQKTISYYEAEDAETEAEDPNCSDDFIGYAIIDEDGDTIINAYGIREE